MLDDKKAILPHLAQADQAAGGPGQPTSADNSDVAEASLPGKYRTDKQRQASRLNGRKSHGPTSPEGNQKAAQNAVRDGIFSRQIVIEELGETREDFDRKRASIFESIQPCGALEESLAMDFFENMFVRERVRRAEERERSSRLQTLQLENELMRSDQMEKLRHQFLVQLQDYLGNWNPNYLGLPAELDQVRRELMSMSEGVDFLLELLEQIELDFEGQEGLSAKQAAVFHAVRGSGHPFDVRRRIENLTTESDSPLSGAEVPEFEATGAQWEPNEHGEDDFAEGDEPLDQASSDLARKGIAMLLNSVAESLRERKEKLQRIEDAERQNQIRLIMLDPSPSERFSRAETSLERKMYRALAAITAAQSYDNFVSIIVASARPSRATRIAGPAGKSCARRKERTGYDPDRTGRYRGQWTSNLHQ